MCWSSNVTFPAIGSHVTQVWLSDGNLHKCVPCNKQGYLYLPFFMRGSLANGRASHRRADLDLFQRMRRGSLAVRQMHAILLQQRLNNARQSITVDRSTHPKRPSRRSSQGTSATGKK